MTMRERLTDIIADSVADDIPTDAIVTAILEEMKRTSKPMVDRANELERIYHPQKNIHGYCWLVYTAMIDEALR